MLRLSILLGTAAFAIVVACGSDSKKSIDAPPAIDAPGGSAIDARMIDAPGSGSGSGSSALGVTCTVGSGSNTQGSCPAGFDCLNPTGGTNPWCSKRCAQGSGDTCAMGYTGPGYATCDLTYTVGSGSGVLYCSVTCDSGTAGSAICPSPATCDGHCPGTLMCNGTLTPTGKFCD